MAFSPTEKKWKTSRLNYGDEKLYFSRKMCFEWLVVACKRIPILRDSAITSISKMSVFYCFLLFIRLFFHHTARWRGYQGDQNAQSLRTMPRGWFCVQYSGSVCEICDKNCFGQWDAAKQKIKIECRSFSSSHRGKFWGNEQFMKFPPPSSHTISVRNVFIFYFCK